MLQELLGDLKIKKREYLLKGSESWVPCSEEDTEDMDTSSCNVFLRVCKRGLNLMFKKSPSTEMTTHKPVEKVL